ncbi:MAG: YkgJ family cysteine cluster protein [Spirochaetales bacterium]|nr:YkgJ family cysteine cluster protein [Spirochaetales bacterium]
MSEIFREYELFLKDVDRLAGELHERLKDLLLCRAGCSSCCQPISLLPLEWHWIKSRLTDQGKNDNQNTERGRCPFLRHNLCTIYDIRPLICRTHGLPLLYLNSEGTSWELSLCDLNEEALDEECWEDLFQNRYFLEMDKWNSRLNRLNQRFLENKPEYGDCLTARIPMAELPEPKKEEAP